MVAAVKLPASVPGVAIVAVVGLMGLGLVGLYIWRKGGIAGAAAKLGSAAVDVAGGVASGAVGAVGAAAGLPTPADTTTDAAVARWIIDNHGYFTASKWAGVPALAKGWTMDAGTGVPPAAGTPAYEALVKPQSSYGGATGYW